MQEAEFIGQVVLAFGALVAIIVPIVRLNSNIVKLETTLLRLVQDEKDTNLRIDINTDRIIKINQDITRHDTKLKSHEARIQILEKSERGERRNDD